jgi:spore coat protein U-like protein
VPRLRLLAAVTLLGLARTAAAACTVSVVGPSFGTYDPFATAPLDAAGSITFSCTSPALIGISQGNSGRSSQREMRSGSERLLYNLYTDAARTSRWGRVGGNFDIQVGAGNNQRIPIYGRVPALQDVAPGTYSDTLVLTFQF